MLKQGIQSNKMTLSGKNRGLFLHRLSVCPWLDTLFGEKSGGQLVGAR